MNGAGKFHPAPARDMPWLIISVLTRLMDGLVPVHLSRKNSRLVRSCVSLLIVWSYAIPLDRGSRDARGYKRTINRHNRQSTHLLHVCAGARYHSSAFALSSRTRTTGRSTFGLSICTCVSIRPGIRIRARVPIWSPVPPLSVSVCVLLVPFSSACLLSLLA
jgi:hypothetical protein